MRMALDASVETIVSCIVAPPNPVQSESCVRHHHLFTTAAVAAFVAGAAIAQSNAPKRPKEAPGSWVAPGTPASPIKGDLFHAQVLLDVAGFSPGAIDGRAGSSQTEAIRGFQQANGLNVSGKLDAATKAALMKSNRPSTVTVKLTAED